MPHFIKKKFKFIIMKFREIIKKFGSYGTVVLGAMTFESYIRGLRKDLIVDPKIQNLADSYEQLTATTKELADKDITNEVTKSRIESYGEVGRRSIDKVKNSAEKIQNLNEQLKESTVADKTNIQNQLLSANDELKNGLNEVNNTIKSIIELAKGDNSSSNSFIDLNTIQEFLVRYQIFIDQLSQEQKFSIIHIFFSISILFCLFTLLGIHSGDKIIKYFRLEEKYPKLAKYIVLRRRIQTYSFY